MTTPCDGCGATKSSERCIGCMHHFGDGDDWVLPKKAVAPNEIAQGAWKLRMCYYDEDGEITASREPEAEEIVRALESMFPNWRGLSASLNAMRDAP